MCPVKRAVAEEQPAGERTGRVPRSGRPPLPPRGTAPGADSRPDRLNRASGGPRTHAAAGSRPRPALALPLVDGGRAPSCW